MGTAAGLLVDVPWSCRLVLGGYCGAAVWPNSHARLLPLCNISDKSKVTQPLHHSPSLQQLLVLPASSRHPVSSILQLLTIVTDLAHQHHPKRCPLRKSSKNAVFFLCINSCVWVFYEGKWVCSQTIHSLKMVRSWKLWILVSHCLVSSRSSCVPPPSCHRTLTATW